MIRLEIPYLPPSSNHAYFNLPRGGRTLSTAGRKFKDETKVLLAQLYPNQLRVFRPNTPYLVVVRFYFEELENKGYATGKAKSRYKVFDGGNRTKLLEDVLKDVGGIDDSQTLTSTWQKMRATPERTVIWVWDLEKESTPFDGPLRALQ